MRIRFRHLFLVFCVIGISLNPGHAQHSLPENPAPAKDTTYTASLDPRISQADSLEGKAVLDSVPLAKKVFNHREQIITGGVVMGCLALILASMNNYNPR